MPVTRPDASAKDMAKSMDRRPETRNASGAQTPTAAAAVAGSTKIPLPTIVFMEIAARSQRPSVRTRPGGQAPPATAGRFGASR